MKTSFDLNWVSREPSKNSFKHISICPSSNNAVIGQNKYMSEWFTLGADKRSNGDALQMANYFYETGLFEHTEPAIFKLVVE